MVTREESFNLMPEYPIERLGDPREILFFDIETTGLSADKNQVYMIGVLNRTESGWHLIQWLSDTVESEIDILMAFFTYLRDFKILISFNGDAFDIPFLLKRCQRYKLECSFEGVNSIDIYRFCRPYKNILGLKNCRQKSIENFLGIERDDVYSGGELINVYLQYLYLKDPSFADLLLLHNSDDLKGMPKILSVLSYPDLFSSTLRLRESGISNYEDQEESFLSLRCVSDISVPEPVSIKKDPVYCGIRDNNIVFYIRLRKGTLKHYFDNPSDYYYLICEDMAVHKSVGTYVAREARRQATAKTCYVKQKGVFLPQFDAIWEPVMKADLNDNMCYVYIDSVSLDDEEKWNKYSSRLLSWLSHGI